MPAIITVSLEKGPEAIQKSSRGFTLLELSMVLLIMSLILGTTLGFLAEKTDTDKIKETERRMDKIEQAIAQFVVQNKYLPCPALPDEAPSAAAFGQAANQSAVFCLSYVGSPFINDPNDSDTGAVPTKTLQIPDEYAFDAWGRRFTFAIAEFCHDINQFVIASGMCSGRFTIRDASGATKTADAVLVLVSHGKNGHGAFMHNGGTTRLNAYVAAVVDADELINGHLSNAGAYVSSGGFYVQKSRTSTFDDIVRYKTRAQIIKETGGMTGMGGSLIPRDSIDPLCRMIDSKMGAVYPTVIPNPNVPLLATTQSICGLTTVAQKAASSCDDYMLELAEKVYAFCL